MDDDWSKEYLQEGIAEDEYDYKTYKDSTLYAIEVSQSMLKRHHHNGSDDPKSSVELALEAVYDTIKNRLLTSPGDNSGIILYGSKKTTDSAYSLCNIIMPLGAPSGSILRNLRNIIEDKSKFDQEIEADEKPPSLGVLFQLAMQQFDNVSHIKASRRFFIITDNDNPTYGNAQQRTAAKTNAEELVNKNVIIEPAFLIRKDPKTEGDITPSSFNMSLFWDDVAFTKPLTEEEDDNVENEPVPSSYFVSDLSMRTSLFSRRSPKRALFNNRIELAPGIQIGVKGYLTFAKQKFMRTHYIYTQGEEKQFVKSEVQTTIGESARTVSPDVIKRAYKFGDTYVYFTPEQVDEIRKIEDPVIRIIGFKSPKLIPHEYNKRHSMFIYPSDAQLTGSIRAFNSLYRTMLAKEKVAIVWAVLRQNSIPEPCALFPVPEETEKIGGTDIQVTAPGFQLVHLPYADDIRTRPQSEATQGKNQPAK